MRRKRTAPLSSSSVDNASEQPVLPDEDSSVLPEETMEATNADPGEPLPLTSTPAASNTTHYAKGLLNWYAALEL